MNPIINPWSIYLINVLSGLKNFFIAAVVVAIFVGIGSAIYFLTVIADPYYDEDDEKDQNKILNINYLISGSIREVGEKVLNTNISFEQLIIKINSNVLIDDSLNIFSFDGVIKSFTSVSLLNLLFSYALRYVMIKVFVLLTPFAITTLLNNSTSWIFKSWMKSVITLLVVQSFVSIILVVIFSMTFSSGDTFSKLIYIGSIYALIKANSFLRQIIGGIATEISGGMSGIKNLIK